MARPIIWLATTNDFKLSEYKKLLPNYEIKSILDLKQKYLETKEEGATFGENALLKARDLAHFIKGTALGDDSGIEVEALNNFPGIFSKRWALPETDWEKINKKLLTLVENSPQPKNRQATMTTALALYDYKTGKKKIFEARVAGKLAHSPEFHGLKDFGYDPIFIPNGYQLPYSKISITEKNQSSPRALAVKKFIHYLERNLKN